MPFPYVSRRLRLVLSAAVATSAVAAALVSVAAVSAGPARASTALPVNYDFITGALAGLDATTPPPGANNWSCQPTAAHPYPVILVHGTFANMDDNWQAAAPLLANHGYCVYAFNYGGSSPTSDIQGTGDIAAGAATLASFVNQVLASTGAPKVDLVGHSLGGMMPRYYINNLGGASKVREFVSFSATNYGTTWGAIGVLAHLLGVDIGTQNSCVSCAQETQGSAFLAALNVTPTVPGPHYTAIGTKDDEIVTPYTSAFLPAAANVTNITVQNQCPLDASDHLEIAADPVALADMLNALDPAHPVQVPCLAVLPVTGPVGPVPSF
jgi:triacylglycerol esterase/lipase EstA (alpha/beta hydrolase family)